MLRAVIIGACMLGSTLPASADPFASPQNVEARAHLKRGNRFYQLREFEKAVEELRAGAFIEDVPVFHYNLAQAYRQLGLYKEALWHYERFQSLGRPTGPLKEGVENHIASMKSELEKAAALPEREPPPEPQQAPPVTALGTSVTQPATTVGVSPVEREEQWYADKLGWGIVGAGVVGAGVFLGLRISANGFHDDANREDQETARDALRRRAGDRGTLATVVGVASGAVLATGVVKLVLHPRHRRGDGSRTTSLAVGAGLDRFFVTGTF